MDQKQDTDNVLITAEQFDEGCKTLNLDSDADLAKAFRCSRVHINRMRNGVCEPGGQTSALMRIYLDGYRPDWWPKKSAKMTEVRKRI